MDSLGNMALSAVREHASEIRITADPALRTARVVALTDEPLTDDEYDLALGRLVELHDFYTDKLSLSFAIEAGSGEQKAGEFSYSG